LLKIGVVSLSESCEYDACWPKWRARGSVRYAEIFWGGKFGSFFFFQVTFLTWGELFGNDTAILRRKYGDAAANATFLHKYSMQKEMKLWNLKN